MKRIALVLSCLALLQGLLACTPMGNLQPQGEVRYLTADDIARMAQEPTRIQAGDTLRIVRDAQDAALDLRNLVEDSQSQLYVVRPDGSFSFKHAGRLDAAGKTPDALAAEITQKLSVQYRQPGVTVNIVSSPSSKVVIGGAVRAPGAIDMTAVATLEQGLFAVGGLLPSADPSHVALLRLDDAQRYQLYFVDLSQLLTPVAGGSATLALRRGDILFVPKSAAGNVGDGVEVYINQILPFSRSLGVGYSWSETRVK
jgi:protein involved in polysaccharide export with SLBB domain